MTAFIQKWGTSMAKYDRAFLCSLAEAHGGQCLSQNAETQKDVTEWQCKNNHVGKTQLRNIIAGRWCRKCAQRHSIEHCHNYAKQKNGKCLSTTYDGTDAKLTWECENGHQWKATPQKIKQGRWCPYCAGKNKDISYYKKLAQKRGGICVSDTYINWDIPLRWRCAHGHEWEARPTNVAFGTWCPQCAGRKQTIEDLHTIARQRKGKCLSREYHGQARKVLWECADGHQW